MASQLPRVCHESLALTTEDIPSTPLSSLRSKGILSIWQFSKEGCAAGQGAGWGPAQCFRAVPGSVVPASGTHVQEPQEEAGHRARAVTDGHGAHGHLHALRQRGRGEEDWQ